MHQNSNLENGFVTWRHHTCSIAAKAKDAKTSTHILCMWYRLLDLLILPHYSCRKPVKSGIVGVVGFNCSFCQFWGLLSAVFLDKLYVKHLFLCVIAHVHSLDAFRVGSWPPNSSYFWAVYKLTKFKKSKNSLAIMYSTSMTTYQLNFSFFVQSVLR